MGVLVEAAAQTKSSRRTSYYLVSHNPVAVLSSMLQGRAFVQESGDLAE
jgi:hypothetical protein